MPKVKVEFNEVYTLRRHWSTKRKDAEDLRQMKEIAYFDEMALAEAYKTALEGNESKEANVTSEEFDIVTTLSERDIDEHSFNMPFNPVFEKTEAKPTKAKTRNSRIKEIINNKE